MKSATQKDILRRRNRAKLDSTWNALRSLISQTRARKNFRRLAFYYFHKKFHQSSSSKINNFCIETRIFRSVSKQVQLSRRSYRRALNKGSIVGMFKGKV